MVCKTSTFFTFVFFAFGRLSAEPAPIPSQPSAGYMLGVYDEILVHVADLEELPDKPVRVNNSGDVELPVVGRLHAQGLTTEQVEAAVVTRLRVYLKQPRVTVSVVEFRDQPVTILGAVNQPGVKQVHEPKRLFEVLSEAGGLRSTAGSTIRIARPVASGPLPLNGAHPDAGGEYQIAELSVASVVGSKKPAENIPVLPHDVITVPSAQMVYVLGEVTHPGSYEIGENQTISILDALAKAGGSMRNALTSRARVLRPIPGTGERSEQDVDINRILAGKAKDFALQSEDIVYLPTNRGKVVATRVIEAMIGTGTSITAFRSSH